MMIDIRIPSKTFILGEYAVLTGGSALILNTEPYFSCRFTPNEIQQNPFHPQSPAGNFIRTYNNSFENYSIEFTDPHSLGGFGRSGAEFLSVYAFHQNIQQKPWTITEALAAYKDMLKLCESRNTRNPQKTYSPSGADIVAQISGHMTYYKQTKNSAAIQEWPFPDLSFIIMHTGNKIATHDHLASLPMHDFTAFDKIVQIGQQACEQRDHLGFLQAIQSYAELLHKNALVTDHTTQLLNTLRTQPYILAVKGCGALGADVIIAFTANHHLHATLDWLKIKNFHIIHHGQQTGHGLQLTKTVPENYSRSHHE